MSPFLARRLGNFAVGLLNVFFPISLFVALGGLAAALRDIAVVKLPVAGAFLGDAPRWIDFADPLYIALGCVAWIFLLFCMPETEATRT